MYINSQTWDRSIHSWLTGVYITSLFDNSISYSNASRWKVNTLSAHLSIHSEALLSVISVPRMNTIYSIYLQEPLLCIELWIEYSFHTQCTIFILRIYQAWKISPSARGPHYRNVVLHNKTSSILFSHWPYTENNPPLIFHYSKDTFISTPTPWHFSHCEGNNILDTVNYILFSFQNGQ